MIFGAAFVALLPTNTVNILMMEILYVKIYICGSFQISRVDTTLP